MDLFIENPRPVEDKTLAIVILVLNIVPLPGVGTLVYNLQTKDDKWINAIIPMVLGLTGMLWILGVIWGVIDGIKIYQASEAYRTGGGQGTTATWTTTSAPPTTGSTQPAAGAEDQVTTDAERQDRAWQQVPERSVDEEATEDRPSQ